MKGLVWVVVLIVILIGGYYLLQQSQPAPAADMGTYVYTCENGSQFSMTPSADVNSIELSAGSQGMFSGNVTLNKVESTAGARYEGTVLGSNIVFVGAGEEVQLTVGSESTVCNPVPSTESPPWNWGDPGEGGGVKQDVGLIVSESIVGRWRSVEDDKFTREFKGDGTAVDTYEGKDVTSGTWRVYTKENPLEVAFPLEENVVYIQMTMQGTQADNLNFKLTKLTPEELELIYMDGGGVLRFKAIQ